MHMTSCDANVDDNSITWQNNFAALYFHCLNLRMQWCHWWHCRHYVRLMPASVNKNLHTVSVILTLWILWCYWQCYWHHMMLIPVPAVSNGWKSHVASHFNHLEQTNVMLLWCCHQCHVMSTLPIHDQKSHVKHCFNHLDLANKMLPVTVPSVSCDACTGANNITWPKVMGHLILIVFT